jgi:hypothetical protein
MKTTKQRLTSLLIAIIVLFMLSSLLPPGLSDNYSITYQLLNHPDGTTYYSLNVTVPQSLLEYYTARSHTLNSQNDFAKFVTPHALQPIADSLKQIYTNNEDFVNGVLMIVHQIPYEVTIPPKYPVETIEDNKGDCDLFSFIAASIIKASSLKVVLLYYEHEEHMNIGVNLPQSPQDARTDVSFVTNNGEKYYVAECTSDKWQTGWRIGECPTDLKNATPQVITLENTEQETTGQVSASYKTLTASSITLTASSSFLVQGTAVTFSGTLSPNLQNENVTIYIRADTSPWTVLDEAATDSEGHFTYAWIADTSGTCYVRATWSGNDNYAVADSPIQSLTILSTFFLALIVLTTVLVSIGLVAFIMGRQAQPGISEPQPPEIPS